MIVTRWMIAWIGLAALAATVSCKPTGGEVKPVRAATGTYKIQEKSLGPIDPTATSAAVSADGRHLAYIALRDQKQCVIQDGRAGEPYEAFGAGSLLFSPDGRHLAYMALKGSKQIVVLDGQAVASYDGIGAGTLVFSADSKRFAYCAQKGRQTVVVVDGREGRADMSQIAEGLVTF